MLILMYSHAVNTLPKLIHFVAVVPVNRLAMHFLKVSQVNTVFKRCYINEALLSYIENELGQCRHRLEKDEVK